MVTQPQIRVIRFGEYEFDLQSSELRKHGHKLPLPEQALQILAMLLDHPGKFIPREHLIARLWPAGMVVEFDRGTNSSVRRLRAVLNDSAERPRYIETLPKRGYRFIYPVEAARNHQASQSPTQTRVHSSTRRVRAHDSGWWQSWQLLCRSRPAPAFFCTGGLHSFSRFAPLRFCPCQCHPQSRHGLSE